MNERDWQTTANAHAMLDHLFPVRGLDSVEPQSRKSRLYLLACARRAWDRLPGVCRVVVVAAERVFSARMRDVQLQNTIYDHAEVLTHCRGVTDDVNEIGRRLVELGHANPRDVWADSDVPCDEWAGYAHLAYFPFAAATPHFLHIPPDLLSADLVREVFGNPFARQPPIDRQWHSETVLQMARGCDATADFTILPYLADALEDAGCNRTDLLDHLRAGGTHVRGCWALEQVLDGR